MIKRREHKIEDVIRIFDQCFAQTEQTRLLRGDDEPLYKPAADGDRYHRVIFAHGFYRSALHEVAHWCIAGKVRRQLLDYGYWYKPDGRDAAEQANFEQVELKPQALEWLFCLNAGHSFEVSCDNLAAAAPNTVDRLGFANKVRRQLLSFVEGGVPPRAVIFARALRTFYGLPDPLLTTLREAKLNQGEQLRQQEIRSMQDV